MRTKALLLASLLSLAAIAQQTDEPLVYPNPAGDEMSVRVSDKVKDVVVHDLLGNELVLQELGDDHGMSVASIGLPVERFPSGMYIMSLRADGKRVLVCERFKVVR